MKAKTFLAGMTIVFVGLLALRCASGKALPLRESAISGSWYPGQKEAVIEAIKGLEGPNGRGAPMIYAPGIRPIFMVVPHAGWQYSGRVAAAAFSRLAPFKGDITTVFLLAPAHRVGFIGASCPEYSAYETPLGLVPVDQRRCERLRELPFVASIKKAHRLEHSIEIELPFLQYYLGRFELVPILISTADGNMLKALGEKISGLMDRGSIIVVSSDFTHYGPRYGYMPLGKVEDGAGIKELDMGAFSRIRALDPKGLERYVAQRRLTICGRWPICAGLYAVSHGFPKDQLSIDLIAYDQSGRITRDYTNSVSYMAVEIVHVDGKRYLPALARRSIEAAFGLGPWPQEDEVGDALFYKRPSGCFVTIETMDGQLRGCIGNIRPVVSLFDCVEKNAVNAAFRDPRFPPLEKRELEHVQIEVSVLTPPEPLEFKGAQDLLDRIRPGVHGVVLKRGPKGATFLPQVWEKLPEKEVFLSRLCLKAGMEKGCWKDPDTQVFTYEVKAFSEGAH